ncbi:MAG TPA: PAS domain-containing protein, partial [Oculatellaceae cyanobacterium]
MTKFRKRFLPYAVAIGSTAIALLLRLWLEFLLSRSMGAFFYLAIIVSAWYGGLRPGFVAVVLSTLAINYFLIPPRYQFWFEQPKDVFELGTFLLVAFLINLLTSNFRDSKQKIERLSQQLAQENAQQLRMALSAAQMGMWDWNIVTGEINWSPEHEQLFGLSPGTFDGKYETVEACLHPDDREKLNQAVERSRRERVPYQHEFRVVWADGSIHWIEERGQAFYDEAGQPVRMTGTVMAIDDRKLAEMALVRLNCELEQRVQERTAELTEVNERLLEALIALRESEERRRLALDLTHTGFWDLHLPSGKLIWNDNHFTLLGLAPNDIEPSYELWRSRIHPDDIGWVEQRFLESIENHADYTNEYRVVHPDNSVHWVMGRGKAIYDELGQPVRSLGVLLDISDRKRAEETLQQYERIISNTKDGIALMNRHYIYQVANQGYLSWCNKSAHEVIGNSVRNILGQDLFDNFIQPRLEQCFAGESIQYERWFDYPNLVPQFLSVTYTPYRDASENISGVIVSLRDLTQLKQAEQTLELQAVITRNMAEGICLVKADNGVIVYANPKFEQMFGYDSGELNGQHVSIVNYPSDGVTPEDVNQ